MPNRRVSCSWLALLAVGFFGLKTPAVAAVIDFEGFADVTVLTTQVGGLTFTNATVLKSGAAGGSLNEIDFPPHSGVNVVVDNGGLISIVFASPQANVGGFFTYSTSVTLTAFDALDNAVGSDTSASTSNLGSHEFLEVAFAGGISKVTLLGAAAGGAFVLDDLTLSPASIPEPSTLLLLAGALAGAIGRKQMGRRLQRG